MRNFEGNYQVQKITYSVDNWRRTALVANREGFLKLLDEDFNMVSLGEDKDKEAFLFLYDKLVKEKETKGTVKHLDRKYNMTRRLVDVY